MKKLTKNQKNYLKFHKEEIKRFQLRQDYAFKNCCDYLRIDDIDEEWLFDYLYNDGSLKDLEANL